MTPEGVAGSDVLMGLRLPLRSSRMLALLARAPRTPCAPRRGGVVVSVPFCSPALVVLLGFRHVVFAHCCRACDLIDNDRYTVAIFGC